MELGVQPTSVAVELIVEASPPERCMSCPTVNTCGFGVVRANRRRDAGSGSERGRRGCRWDRSRDGARGGTSSLGSSSGLLGSSGFGSTGKSSSGCGGREIGVFDVLLIIHVFVAADFFKSHIFVVRSDVDLHGLELVEACRAEFLGERVVVKSQINRLGSRDLIGGRAGLFNGCGSGSFRGNPGSARDISR